MSSIKSYNQISVRLLKLDTEAEMDTVNSLPRFLQPDSPKNHELNSSQVNLNLIFVLRLACLLPTRSKTPMEFAS